MDGTAITTYRYLRLALVVLVVLLGAAVLIEWWHTGRSCVQTSISGYYFTPVRPVLVGTLVAVGVCLIALRGSDDREDVLLNLAGMLAPVIAFVPTPDHGPCSSVPVATPAAQATAAYVANNVAALLVAGVLGVGLTVAAVVRRRARSRSQVVGTLMSIAVLVGGGAWFAVGRTSFIARAHYVAAVGLFLAFVAVVWLNARGQERSRSGAKAGMLLGLRTRYAAVAIAMVVVPAVVFAVGLITGWPYVLLVVEAVLIGLFATFWLLQTAELGDLPARDQPRSGQSRTT